jgi:hypothetical protein
VSSDRAAIWAELSDALSDMRDIVRAARVRIDAQTAEIERLGGVVEFQDVVIAGYTAEAPPGPAA